MESPKTPARTVQAALTMGFTLGLVGLLLVAGGLLIFRAGGITLSQALATALPWAPVLFVVGACWGAIEFRLRRSRRD